MTINTLINKQDGFEIIRDAIAAILTLETASQQAIAAAEGENPDLWAFRVFKERADVWAYFQNSEDVEPIVNVYFNGHQTDMGASNLVDRQTVDGRFNIDVYGRGLARTDGDGHTPGDLDATLTAQRTARLVRNILMSNNYYRLGLPAQAVANRIISQVQAFQPQQDNQNAIQVTALRLTLDVRFNEFAPQQQIKDASDPGPGDPFAGYLETILTDITLTPSGELVAKEIDFT